MKKLTFFLLLIPFISLSKSNLDSLWSVWNDPTQTDTSRLKAMHKIARKGYLFSQPDSAFYFAQLQYDLANKSDNKMFMAKALSTQGISFATRGQYPQAINYFSKSLKIDEELGNKKGMAKGLNNIGLIYKNQGDYANAINYFIKSLKIKQDINDKKGIANSFHNIGNIYINKDENEKALIYYEKALKIYKDIGNKKGVAASLNNMGVIYKRIGDYDLAISNYEKALAIRLKLDDEKGISSILNNIGLIHYNQGSYSQALDYFFKSLEAKEKIGDKRGEALTLHNIGKVYLDQASYQKALQYSKKSLNISVEIGAIKQIKDATLSLWKINKKLGNFKKALEMYELYIKSRDSIASEENQKELIRQEYKYKYEKQAAADSVKAAEAAKVKDAKLTAERAENKRHQVEAKQQRQQKYFLFGGLALALVFGGFIFNRFRLTRKQKSVIEKQKEKVDEAYEELDEKNQEILDSIIYAKRIQSAILPPKKLVKEYIPESFILYKPKDIVAGDFYWMEPQQDGVIIAAADCTGHGVPGAMVSVVCNNGLNRSVREYGLTEPAKILDKTREIVIAEFEKSEEDVKDGMDISLVSLAHRAENENESESHSHSHSHSHSVLQYAGAHNPLWIIRKGAEAIEEIKANKQPIGKFGAEQPFTNHTVELQKGDSIYIFSDGFSDQFGGEMGKKFKSKNFKKLLLSVQNETMERQRQIIDETFEDWRRDLEQLDDVCVIGVRL